MTNNNYTTNTYVPITVLKNINVLKYDALSYVAGKSSSPGTTKTGAGTTIDRTATAGTTGTNARTRTTPGATLIILIIIKILKYLYLLYFNKYKRKILLNKNNNNNINIIY